jgi:hypothetical protein
MLSNLCMLSQRAVTLVISASDVFIDGAPSPGGHMAVCLVECM